MSFDLPSYSYGLVVGLIIGIWEAYLIWRWKMSGYDDFRQELAELREQVQMLRGQLGLPRKVQRECPNCHGAGQIACADGRLIGCASCKGTGVDRGKHANV